MKTALLVLAIVVLGAVAWQHARYLSAREAALIASLGRSPRALARRYCSAPGAM